MTPSALPSPPRPASAPAPHLPPNHNFSPPAFDPPAGPTANPDRDSQESLAVPSPTALWTGEKRLQHLWRPGSGLVGTRRLPPDRARSELGLADYRRLTGRDVTKAEQRTRDDTGLADHRRSIGRDDTEPLVHKAPDDAGLADHRRSMSRDVTEGRTREAARSPSAVSVAASMPIQVTKYQPCSCMACSMRSLRQMRCSGPLLYLTEARPRLFLDPLVYRRKIRLIVRQARRQEVTEAAVVIQTVWRGFIAQVVLELLKVEMGGALVIQTVWRGHHQRSFWKYTRYRRRRAATSIQCWYRFHRRRLVRLFTNVSLLIQRYVRGFITRCKYRRMRQVCFCAAIKMEAVARGLLARRHLALFRVLAQRSAIAIQCVYRTYHPKRQLQWHVHERYVASRQLQSLWRGRVARRYFLVLTTIRKAASYTLVMFYRRARFRRACALRRLRYIILARRFRRRCRVQRRTWEAMQETLRHEEQQAALEQGAIVLQAVVRRRIAVGILRQRAYAHAMWIKAQQIGDAVKVHLGKVNGIVEVVLTAVDDAARREAALAIQIYIRRLLARNLLSRRRRQRQEELQYLLRIDMPELRRLIDCNRYFPAGPELQLDIFNTMTLVASFKAYLRGVYLLYSMVHVVSPDAVFKLTRPAFVAFCRDSRIANNTHSSDLMNIFSIANRDLQYTQAQARKKTGVSTEADSSTLLQLDEFLEAMLLCANLKCPNVPRAGPMHTLLADRLQRFLEEYIEPIGKPFISRLLLAQQDHPEERQIIAQALRREEVRLQKLFSRCAGHGKNATLSARDWLSLIRDADLVGTVGYATAAEAFLRATPNRLLAVIQRSPPHSTLPLHLYLQLNIQEFLEGIAQCVVLVWSSKGNRQHTTVSAFAEAIVAHLVRVI